jgi:hypothetical protein
MLLCVVIVRFHSRYTAAHAASSTSFISFISFTSHCFRTLASHFQTSVSSNSFEIKRFRTLCKIPGIGYPPFLHFCFSAHYSAQKSNLQISCFLFAAPSSKFRIPQVLYLPLLQKQRGCMGFLPILVHPACPEFRGERFVRRELSGRPSTQFSSPRASLARPLTISS